MEIVSNRLWQDTVPHTLRESDTPCHSVTPSAWHGNSLSRLISSSLIHCNKAICEIEIVAWSWSSLTFLFSFHHLQYVHQYRPVSISDPTSCCQIFITPPESITQLTPDYRFSNGQPHQSYIKYTSCIFHAITVSLAAILQESKPGFPQQDSQPDDSLRDFQPDHYSYRFSVYGPQSYGPQGSWFPMVVRLHDRPDNLTDNDPGHFPADLV